MSAKFEGVAPSHHTVAAAPSIRFNRLTVGRATETAKPMVCDLLQKIELFHAAGTQMTPPHGPEIVKTFYDILTVLDSKGLALLAFDGIVVAATTFAAEKGGVFHRRGMARWLAILTIVLSLAGAALCLWVSEISYSFFHYVDCTAPGRLDFSNEINRLATLVDWRTAYYQIAWWCSMIAIPSFFILFWGSLSWSNRPAHETHERPEKAH